MGPFLTIAVLALDLFALYFIFKSKSGGGKKALWVVLVLVLPFVGAVAYFLVNGTNAPPSDSVAHDGRSATEKRYQA